MVEDMEEGIECLGRIHPLLNIINNQYVDALVEVDEVVGGIVAHGIRELHLEQPGRDIQHPLGRIDLLAPHTDSIDQMGLATARGAVDEEWIKSGLSGMLGNVEPDSTGQLVGVAFDEVLESLLGIELGIQLLRRSGIKRRRSLVGTLLLLNRGGTLTLNGGRHIVLGLDSNDTVIQLDACTEHPCKNLA